MQVTENLVKINGNNLFVLSNVADHSKPTFVFLHGFTANHSTWLPFNNKLLELGHNTLLVDLIGHGYSDKPLLRDKYTVRQMAKDLVEVLDKKDIQQAILVGYSGGGYVSLQAAQMFPNKIKKVIAISTNVSSPAKRFGLNILKKPISKIVESLAYLNRSQDPQKWRYVDFSDNQGYWTGVKKGFQGMPASINMWTFSEALKNDFRDLVRSIRVDTIFIVGKNDPFVSKNEILALTEQNLRVKLRIIDSAGHFLASEYLDRLMPILESELV